MEELFAPGRKHTEDERQRLALTREDIGDGDPHRGPIDLASGKVTIRIPASPEDTAPENASREDDPPGDASPGEAPREESARSGRGVEEAEAVGEGGGLAAAGDAELGEDVGDVDAGGLR
ncbi:DUF6191 domain-containing protein [Streptomyces sp. NPDC059071]|uniref:DUF6191 domain-containing protein n=1 Tax=unclassified Streptomyces TaxID=2593676 RepID=UPI00364FC09F